MAQYIKRTDALYIIDSAYGAKGAYKRVKELPAEDVEPVIHARWVDKYGGKYDNPHYICSVCGQSALYRFERNELGNAQAVQELSNGCPKCLARMDLEE